MDDPQRFRNMLDVVAWLNRNGFRIGKSAAYDHQKRGRIRADEDGSFSLEAVKRYAASLKKADGANAPDETVNLQQKKLAAEAKRITAQAELAELKVEITTGQYITRREHEQELTARAQLFKADLYTFARSEANDLARVVKGDPALVTDLMEHLLGRFDEFLDRYSRDIDHVAGARLDG
jgi:hypothetical protein